MVATLAAMPSKWQGFVANSVVRIDCQITLPRCHRKMAARTDFTGKYGLPLSEKTENLLAAL
jgi:hypothetical protein